MRSSSGVLGLGKGAQGWGGARAVLSVFQRDGAEGVVFVRHRAPSARGLLRCRDSECAPGYRDASRRHTAANLQDKGNHPVSRCGCRPRSHYSRLVSGQERHRLASHFALTNSPDDSRWGRAHRTVKPAEHYREHAATPAATSASEVIRAARDGTAKCSGVEAQASNHVEYTPLTAATHQSAPRPTRSNRSGGRLRCRRRCRRGRIRRRESGPSSAGLPGTCGCLRRPGGGRGRRG